MNRQTCEKIRLLLGGLLSRLTENEDFFTDCEFEYLSGNKKYSAKATFDGENMNFIFCGIKRCLSPEDFNSFITEEAEKYEKLNISWHERGKTVFIESDGKRVITKTAGNVLPESATVSSSMSDREYYIKQGPADRLLKAVGILGDNGKIRNDKVRKYNQTDHFVELIDALLRSLTEKNEPVRIVDCACGKSYLSFVLNYYIKEVLGKKCYFTCIDHNQKVIDASVKMARDLGYNNMEFICCDLREYDSDARFDLLLSLHACDIATDMALGFGLSHDIKYMVCVPCCHREMNDDYNIPGFENVLKYGVLKARIADNLTDGLRAMYLEAKGYETSVVEYISPLDTPKNLMIRAEKKRKEDPALLDEYDRICKFLGTKLTLRNY